MSAVQISSCNGPGSPGRYRNLGASLIMLILPSFNKNCPGFVLRFLRVEMIVCGCEGDSVIVDAALLLKNMSKSSKSMPSR